MGWKIVLSALFFVFVVGLLLFYWFVPFSTTEFQAKFAQESNFSVDKDKLQFYQNMRFPKNEISYRVERCPMQKKSDMLGAFQEVSEVTSLSFYPVSSDEEIYVTCDSTERVEEGLFIAGEGGPTNITQAGDFNVITHGQILLFRDSNCATPNVAIHELLHVLGFNHVDSKKSIMYPVSNCDQELDSFIIDLINELYSVPAYSDLAFESVFAVMEGKYLNLNMSIRNIGLKESGKTKIFISADGDVIKELEIDQLEVGTGRSITLTNIWVSKFSVDSIRIFIDARFSELKKENNEVFLEVKNKS